MIIAAGAALRRVLVVHLRLRRDCHGPAGEGKPKLAPPLKGNAFVTSSAADAVAATIKNGRTGAAKKYPDIPQGMPGQPVYDDDLDAVVKYVKEDLQKK